MAEQYCTHITRMLSQSSCSRVDLVFDQYRKQSSRKGSDTREERQVHWKLQSPVIPRQFRNSGGSTSQTLETNFLCCALFKRFTQSLNPQQRVFLAGGLKVDMKTVFRTQGHCEIVPLMRSDHEEADTRLLLRAKLASQTHSKNCDLSLDTDVSCSAFCYSFWRSKVHFEDLKWSKTMVSKWDKRSTEVHPYTLTVKPFLHSIL